MIYGDGGGGGTGKTTLNFVPGFPSTLLNPSRKSGRSSLGWGGVWSGVIASEPGCNPDERQDEHCQAGQWVNDSQKRRYGKSERGVSQGWISSRDADGDCENRDKPSDREQNRSDRVPLRPALPEQDRFEDAVLSRDNQCEVEHDDDYGAYDCE